MSGATAMTPRRERFLRYWAANMVFAWETSGDTPWIGFGYADEEKARMRTLAGTIPSSAAVIFFSVLVVGFIALAAVAVVGFMLPVLTTLYPDPSQTKPLPFVLVLASVCFICLGLGFPLTLGLAAGAADRWGGGVAQPAMAGDAALYAKVRWQLMRITLIMVGLFIPGCMLFILFDIDAGPLVFWLKAACILLAVVSLAGLSFAGPGRSRER